MTIQALILASLVSFCIGGFTVVFYLSHKNKKEIELTTRINKESTRATIAKMILRNEEKLQYMSEKIMTLENDAKWYKAQLDEYEDKYLLLVKRKN